MALRHHPTSAPGLPHPRSAVNKAPLGDIDDDKVAARDPDELEKWLDFYQDTILLEHELSCDCRTAILMAAIDIESEVNRFLFFNIGEETTNTIERLTVEAKLQVAHGVLNLPAFKGTKPHQAVVEIAKWRDKFAHGKIPDMPGRDLRSIHLQGGRLKSSRAELAEMVRLVEFYLVLREYIASIDKTPLGQTLSGDIREIRSTLATIKRFRSFEPHGAVEMPLRPPTRGSAGGGTGGGSRPEKE